MSKSFDQSNCAVHRLGSQAQDTRRNFGPRYTTSCAEADFLAGFERIFLQRHRGEGIVASEFALPGYGVADMVWIGWKSSPAGLTCPDLRKLSQNHLFAFEAKLKDWQGALRQAFRYRYFADKSIALLPYESSSAALRNLTSFQQFNVGLWSFQSRTGAIRQHFTPVRVRALNADARRKALHALTLKLDFGQLGEELDAAA